jgi:hypothetical protein
MAKVCRACQRHAADRGEVCNACRRRVLKDPVAPTPRPRIWMLAALLVGFLSICSSLIAAAIMTHQTLPWSHSLTLQGRLPPSESPVTYQTSMVEELVTRRVYPFSIVPGGTENLDEAKRAMKEPALQANYADVDFTNLRRVTLKKNLSGYVSYRQDEKVYWTSRQLTLRAGETVYTDGIYLVRGRCLNSYSPFPMLPIQPNEPTEQVLDTPVEIPVIAYSFPKFPVLVQELPPSPEALTPTVPIFPPASSATPGGGAWFPLTPIIPPIHRHPPSSRTSPS